MKLYKKIFVIKYKVGNNILIEEIEVWTEH